MWSLFAIFIAFLLKLYNNFIMTYDVIIIGAGASGLMCAASLPSSLNVLLVEKNKTAGKKIEISGGGKCNITNKYVSEQHYVGKKEFVAKTLDSFTNTDLLTFCKNNGLDVVLRKGKFYFCKTSAKDVVKMFLKLTQKHSFSYNTEVLHVEKKENYFKVKTTKGDFVASKVVVASGGASFPSIGGSHSAVEIAKSFTIAHKPFKPALVGLTVQKEQFWMKELSGVSVFVQIKCEEKSFYESLLFTHKGLSGPAVLNASLYWKKGEIEIDFLPNENVLKRLKTYPNKQVTTALGLPKRFGKTFLHVIGLEDKVCKKLTQNDLKKLQIIHTYRFAPAGNFGFSKAEVSLGGVSIESLNENFESCNVSSLYFIGEGVDVTGELGGYNFQWAFASGVKCAKAIQKSWK
jgi:predicted Rossmann fold flavoprotein